jgi:hypothetical protein
MPEYPALGSRAVAVSKKQRIHEVCVFLTCPRKCPSLGKNHILRGIQHMFRRVVINYYSIVLYVPTVETKKNSFRITFRVTGLSVSLTLRNDTFPLASRTQILLHDSCPRIFIGLLGKFLKRRLHINLVVATTMELQIVISATLPSSLRNLRQDGRTKTAFFPIRCKTLLEWCKTLLDWGKSLTTYTVPLGIGLCS